MPLPLHKFLFCITLLTACSPTSSSSPPQPGPGNLRYQEVSGSHGALTTPWWQSFSDRTLRSDINTALTQNLAQQQLGTRIEQAAATLRREGASLFPQIDLLGSTDARAREDGGSSSSATFGAFLSWELDVWGRLRSGVRARDRELQAAFQDWLGGRLILSTSVAETRFLILEQRARLALLQNQLETNQTLLELVRLRVGQGLSSRVDLLQQERQLDATRALVPPAEADLTASQYALDVLTGRPPGSPARDSLAKLPPLPALPSAGIPSQLLVNRPDLLAQWNRILALDAEVGQALADRLPRFSLTGNLGADVVRGASSFFSGLAAEALAPLTDGGERQAEIQRRQAALKDALLGYSNSYLEAIRDVETALVRERKQGERIRLTARQLATARETLTETRIRYSQGLTDYLPVIDSLTAVQTLELTHLRLQREALSLRVALHRALGGPMPSLTPPDFSK